MTTFLEFLHSFRFGTNEFIIEDFPSTGYIVGLLTPIFILILVFVGVLLTFKLSPQRWFTKKVSFSILFTITITILSLTIVVSVLVSQSNKSILLVNEQLDKVISLLDDLRANYSKDEIVSLDYDQARDFNDNADRDCNIAFDNIETNFNISMPTYSGATVELAINAVEYAFGDAVRVSTDALNATRSFKDYTDMYFYWWEATTFFIVFLFVSMSYAFIFFANKAMEIHSTEFYIIEKIIYITFIFFLFLTCVIYVAFGSVAMFGSDLCIPNIDNQLIQVMQFFQDNKSVDVCTIEPYDLICNIQTCKDPNSLPFDDLDQATFNLNFINNYVTLMKTSVSLFDNSTIEALSCNIQLSTLNNFFSDSRIIVEDSISHIRCNQLNKYYEIITDDVFCKHVFSHFGKIWLLLLFVLWSCFELLFLKVSNHP